MIERQKPSAASEALLHLMTHKDKQGADSGSFVDNNRRWLLEALLDGPEL